MIRASSRPDQKCVPSTTSSRTVNRSSRGPHLSGKSCSSHTRPRSRSRDRRNYGRMFPGGLNLLSRAVTVTSLYGMASLGLPYCALTSPRLFGASSSVATRVIISSANHLKHRVYSPGPSSREEQLFSPYHLMRHFRFVNSTHSRTTVQELQILC